MMDIPRYWSEKLPYSDHYVFTFYKLNFFPVSLFKKRKILKKIKIGAFELYVWGDKKNRLFSSIYPRIPSPDEVAEAAWNGEIGKETKE